MHNLCHLVDDVERFGPLDTFSAYSFESKLFMIKNLIRSGNLPLSQVARRVTELQSNLPVRNQSKVPRKCLNKYYKIDDFPLSLQSFLETRECNVYSCVKFEEFKIDCNSDPDQWILLSSLKIIKVHYILLCVDNDEMLLYGQYLKKLSDYFEKRVKSSSLQIFASDLELENSAQIFPINQFYAKMVKVTQSLSNERDSNESIFVPLIHTLLSNL